MITGSLGLGCMRLSTDPDRDEARAVATLEAALDAGITLFDTAHAYGPGDDLGHNERLVGRVTAGRDVVVVTKGGMARPGGRWQPDGRASTVLAHAEASAEALGRVPDLWLLHAPDPRTRFTTTVRAMSRLLDRGLANAVGLSNVGTLQLEEALDHLPVGGVQVAVSPFEDAALRDGVVAACLARGIPVLAHSPLGGTARVARLDRDPLLAELAAKHGATAAQVALAWLQGLGLVPLPGARRPETARAAAVRPPLDDADRARLTARFPSSRRVHPVRPATGEGEVHLIMGLPGAGKTTLAEGDLARGYARLNRDERGGSLRQLAAALDRTLADRRRVVLDNTFLARAVRADFVDAAHRHDVPVRCTWIDAPPAVARLNLCLRMVAQHGDRLPEPPEIQRPAHPGVMPPTQHARMVAQLEPPRADEGFAAVEVVPFARRPTTGQAGAVVLADELGAVALPDVPLLVLAWQPEAAEHATLARAEALERQVGREVHLGVCVHPSGPPVCWCRPPLPGLVALWAHRSGIDPRAIEVLGDGRAAVQLREAFGVV